MNSKEKETLLELLEKGCDGDLDFAIWMFKDMSVDDSPTINQLKEQYKDYNITLKLDWKVLPSTAYIDKSILIDIEEI